MKTSNRQQYHESITIDPYNQGPNSKGVKVSLHTKAVYNITSTANDEQNLLMNGKDSFLISILEKLQLNSFSVSISDSSDSYMSLSDLYKRNSLPIFTKPLTFPVGTTVQYNPSLNIATSNNITTIDEKALLRLLSNSGFLCQNVQLNDQLRSNHPTSTGGPISTDNTRIIMIPNDAYTLCHTKILHKIIASSSPCQDKFGVFSKFQFQTWNHANVFHKAAWMNVYKDNNLGIIEIEWGIRFQKRLLHKNDASLVDILMDRSSLPLHESNLEGVYLEHCPLTKSSTVFNGISNRKYNLKLNPIAMNEELLNLDVIDDDKAIIGIDRHVLRPSGIAHFGTFQSRYYFHCNSRCESNDRSEVGVDISILEHYPNIVKPIFHKAKAFIIGEEKDGSSK